MIPTFPGTTLLVLIWMVMNCSEVSSISQQTCHEQACQNGGTCYRVADWVQNDFCPKNFTAYNGNCYLIGQRAMNWISASQHCQTAYRASLVTIKSPEEQSFLSLILSEQLLAQDTKIVSDQFIHRDYPAVWTSGGFWFNETSKTGRFYWFMEAQDEEIKTETYFDSNELEKQLTRESCISLKDHTNYALWSLDDCEQTLNYYACQIPEPLPESDGHYLYQCRCPAGFGGRHCEKASSSLAISDWKCSSSCTAISDWVTFNQCSQYLIDTDLRERPYCANEQVSFECPKNRAGTKLSIVVDYANYGQPSDSPASISCKPGELVRDINCVAPNALKLVSQRCQGFPRCSFQPDELFTTQPCLPGTPNIYEQRLRCEEADDTQLSCMRGSTPFQGRCYEIFNQDRQGRSNFAQSRSECKKKDGDLVSPIDKDTHEFLKERLQKIGDASGSRSVSSYWIGLQLKVNGKFFDGTWVTGQGYNYSPNDLQNKGMYGDVCALYYIQSNISLWQPKSCRYKANYICQYPPLTKGVQRPKLKDPFLSGQVTPAPINMGITYTLPIYTTPTTTTALVTTTSSTTTTTTTTTMPTTRVTRLPKTTRRSTRPLYTRRPIPERFRTTKRISNTTPERVTSESVTTRRTFPHTSTEYISPSTVRYSATRNPSPATILSTNHREHHTETKKPLQITDKMTTRSWLSYIQTKTTARPFTRRTYPSTYRKLPFDIMGRTTGIPITTAVFEWDTSQLTTLPTTITIRQNTKPNKTNKTRVTSTSSVHSNLSHHGSTKAELSVFATAKSTVKKVHTPRIYSSKATSESTSGFQSPDPVPSVSNVYETPKHPNIWVTKPTISPTDIRLRPSGPDSFGPSWTKNQHRLTHSSVSPSRRYSTPPTPSTIPTSSTWSTASTTIKQTLPPTTTIQEKQHVPTTAYSVSSNGRTEQSKSMPGESSQHPQTLPVYTRPPSVITESTTQRTPPTFVPLVRGKSEMEIPSTVITSKIKVTGSNQTTRQTSSTYTTTTAPSKSHSTQQPTTKPYIPSGNGFCAERTAAGYTWSARTAGSFPTTKKCKNGFDGQLAWYCKTDPRTNKINWFPEVPDDTNCRSKWMKDVTIMIEKKDNANAVMLTLSTKLLGYDLAAGDVKESIEMTTELIKLQEEQVASATAKADTKLQETSKFTKYVGNLTDALLTPKNQKLWNSYKPADRKKQATQLLKNVESSADLVSKYVSRNKIETFDFKYFVMSIDVKSNVLRTDSQSPSWPPSDELPQVDAVDGTGSPVVTRIQLPSLNILADSAAKLNDGDLLQNDYSQETVNLGYYLYKQTLNDLLEPEQLQNQTNSRRVVNSQIIGATVGGRHSVDQMDLKSPLQLTFTHLTTDKVSNAQCVYWNYVKSNWDGNGCRLLKSTAEITTCECDHLTNFAVLMDIGQSFSKLSDDHSEVLNWLSKVGCGVSSLCLLICLFVFTFFPSLWNSRTTIHRNLCLCLLCAELLFLFGIDWTSLTTACTVIAALLHYFLLAAFCWMFIEGYQLYIMLVKVFEESHTIIFHIAGYGIPAVVVAVSAGLKYEDYGTKEYCWIDVEKPVIYAFIVPVSLVILANIVFLVIALKAVFEATVLKDKSKFLKIKRWLRGSTMLLCLLGITWGIGYLSLIPNKTVQLIAAYIFVIVNCLQGVFIFVFHVLFNEKVQSAIVKCYHKNCVCCAGTYDSVNTGSSNTNSNSRNKSSEITNSGSTQNNSFVTSYSAQPTMQGGIHLNTALKKESPYFINNTAPEANLRQRSIQSPAYDNAGMHPVLAPVDKKPQHWSTNNQAATTQLDKPKDKEPFLSGSGKSDLQGDMSSPGIKSDAFNIRLGTTDSHLCSKDCTHAKYQYDPKNIQFKSANISLPKKINSPSDTPDDDKPDVAEKNFVAHF